MSKCVGGKEHGEVFTASDNPGEFDVNVFGEAPPVDYQYGYCRDCKQKMRWSVVSQRWVDWPGPLGSLPPLDDEELETLALVTQIYKDAMPDVMFPAPQRAVQRRVSVLQSLLTAIAETRDGIYRESNRGGRMTPTGIQSFVDEISRRSRFVADERDFVESMPDEQREQMERNRELLREAITPEQYHELVVGADMSEPAIEAFELAYAERSKVSVEFLHRNGRFGAPCDCGDESCDGFQMMHLRDKLIDAGWTPPEAT